MLYHVNSSLLSPLNVFALNLDVNLFGDELDDLQVTRLIMWPVTSEAPPFSQSPFGNLWSSVSCRVCSFLRRRRKRTDCSASAVFRRRRPGRAGAAPSPPEGRILLKACAAWANCASEQAGPTADWTLPRQHALLLYANPLTLGQRLGEGVSWAREPGWRTEAGQ